MTHGRFHSDVIIEGWQTEEALLLGRRILFAGRRDRDDPPRVKVLSGTGSGFASDIIAGINHCASTSLPGGKADVINLSLGGGLFSGTCDGDAVAAAANNAVAAGVVVVSSAGDEGRSNSLGTPACGSDVISVGVTYDDDFPNCEFPDTTSFTWYFEFRGPFCSRECTDTDPTTDSLSCMSNRSTNLDVTAPGCLTYSAGTGGNGSNIVGKTVCEDPLTARADETVGVLVPAT